MSVEAKPSPSVTPAPDLSAGGANMPIWLIAIFILSGFSGLIYVGNHSGWFDAQVYEPFVDSQHLEAWARPPGPGEELKRGKATFGTLCSTCHGDTGTGSATTGCPPLDGSEWVMAAGPNRIIRILQNGLAGPIEVKGGKYGGGAVAMTAVGAALSDQQISDVLTYVRNAWSNKGKGAAPVTIEQVKAVREKIKDKSGYFTPDELLKLPEKD